jgi:hypothetical protein
MAQHGYSALCGSGEGLGSEGAGDARGSRGGLIVCPLLLDTVQRAQGRSPPPNGIPLSPKQEQPGHVEEEEVYEG